MPDIELPQDIINFKNRFLSGQGFDFDQVASILFDYQSRYNPIYREYLKLLKFDLKYPALNQIPHLPISSFKNFTIKTGEWESQNVFQSSSTTGKGRSSHHVRDISWYNAVSKRIFDRNFNSIQSKLILALLPGYLERKDSSLIHMVNHFMELSSNAQNGFFLDEYQRLADIIEGNVNEEIVLFGVPFAFLKCHEMLGHRSWPHATIIETGGMKGKGKEMPRNDFHNLLQSSFLPKNIFSEYGMTELLSQAYTDKDGFFKESETLHIHVKELNDPFQSQKTGKPGTINVIDLANIDTCCFIETEDMGIDLGDGQFEILGRIDNREIRGCNLLA